jgi:hypothetical protein
MKRIKLALVIANAFAVMTAWQTPTASALSFDGAVATYEQALPSGPTDSNGPWAASYAIDGNTSGAWDFAHPNGWGVYNLVVRPALPNVDYTESETAYFRLTNPISTNSTSGIQIAMHFNFDVNPQLTLGCFRISLTTADLHTAPFTLANAQAASWTSVAPLSFVITPSSGPAPTYNLEASNVLLVTGANPARALYTLTFAPGNLNVTGIRLEAIEHAGLPFDGPGRDTTAGNFTLNEITAQAAPVPEPASLSLMAIAGAALLLRRRRVL